MKIIIFVLLTWYSVHAIPVPGFLDGIFGSFGNVFDSVSDTVREIQDEIEKINTNIIDELSKSLKSISISLFNVGGKFNSDIRSFIGSIGNLAKNIGDRVVQVAFDDFKSALSRFVEDLQNSINKLNKDASKTMDNFRNELETIIEKSTKRIAHYGIVLANKLHNAVKSNSSAQHCSDKFVPIILEFSKNSTHELKDCTTVAEDVGKEILENATRLAEEVPGITNKLSNSVKECVQQGRIQAISCLEELTESSLKQVRQGTARIHSMTLDASIALLRATNNIMSCTYFKVIDAIKAASEYEEDIQHCLKS